MGSRRGCAGHRTWKMNEQESQFLLFRLLPLVNAFIRPSDIPKIKQNYNGI